MIVFSSVTKEYRGRPVLNDISFSITPGEFVCITGPSGAGKSTLIHLLIRAELPTSGTIEVDGADLAKLPVSILQMFRRRTGVLFQDYKLLSDRTVAENVAFALEVCGESDEVIAERVQAVLAELKLTEQANVFPSELSGGEKTRAALARALVHEPSILIADEPTGNIDPEQSMEILELLKAINAKGTTVVLASHDKIVVDTLGVRVLRLEGGSLVRDGVGGYAADAAAAPAPEAQLSEPQEKHEEASPHPRVAHKQIHHHRRPAHHEGGEHNHPDCGHVKPMAI